MFTRLVRVLALVCLAAVSLLANNPPELPSYLTLSADSLKARKTDSYPLAGGYTLKVSTGETFNSKGVKIAFCFYFAEVVSAVDNTVIPANPLQFACRETAIAMRDTLATLFPNNRFVLTEHRKIGPYGNTFIEYGVKSDAPCVSTMNAGLLAHRIMTSGEFWPFLVMLEARNYLNGPPGCEE